MPEKPDPISNPLVAGIDNMACASLASSLSKQGSPQPGYMLQQLALSGNPERVREEGIFSSFSNSSETLVDPKKHKAWKGAK